MPEFGISRVLFLVGALLSAKFSFSGAVQLRDITLAPERGVDAPGLIAFPVALTGYLAFSLLRAVVSGRAPWSGGFGKACRGFGIAWLIGVVLLLTSGSIGAYRREGYVVNDTEDVFFFVVGTVFFSIPAIIALALSYWTNRQVSINKSIDRPQSSPVETQ